MMEKRNPITAMLVLFTECQDSRRKLVLVPWYCFAETDPGFLQSNSDQA